jgi:iron(II)-dependent oxidoreductase
MDKFFIKTGKNPEAGSIPQGASWVGALDMAGSLFEWTSSLYKPYPYQADDGREASFDADSTGFRVFRGSPWYHSFQEFDNISATARFEGFTDYAYWYHGFRCARSID